MHIGDYDLYHDLLLKRCGLELSADKTWLLDSHLTPIAKKWDFVTLDAMTMALRGMPDVRLVQDVVEAMTVHDSSFFMDASSFRFFERTAVPYLLKNRQRHRRLRFWCAACATGQEPYSLAIALREMGAQLQGWTVEIMATDISRRVLAQAEKGAFSQLDIQRGLSARLMVKYFDQDKDGQWILRNEVRKMVSFQHFNLLDNMMAIGQFDAIFCRNVLNSFSEKTKRQVMTALAPQLAPDGFLFLAEEEAAATPPVGPLAPHGGVPGLFTLKDSAASALGA